MKARFYAELVPQGRGLFHLARQIGDELIARCDSRRILDPATETTTPPNRCMRYGCRSPRGN